jgi:hypothetical protein
MLLTRKLRQKEEEEELIYLVARTHTAMFVAPDCRADHFPY